MKVIIEKHLLDQVLAICKVLESAEPVEKSNWMDAVPEKHRKFAAYWDEIGRPELELSDSGNFWYSLNKNEPLWNGQIYRIKNDPHWELRLKWVNSGKTLPIEFLSLKTNEWEIDKELNWFDYYQYREAKPWYEQEISKEKPMLLRYIKSNTIDYWDHIPQCFNDWKPLTDKEIDALKRGF